MLLQAATDVPAVTLDPKEGSFVSITSRKGPLKGERGGGTN